VESITSKFEFEISISIGGGGTSIAKGFSIKEVRSTNIKKNIFFMAEPPKVINFKCIKIGREVKDVLLI
jgi:hypothetical protein